MGCGHLMQHCTAILSMYCPVINRVYNSQLNGIQEAMKHIWNDSCIKSTEFSFWFYYFHSYFPRCSIKNSFSILFLCGKVQKAKSVILRSASPLAMICNTRRAQEKNHRVEDVQKVLLSILLKWETFLPFTWAIAMERFS